MAALGFLTAAVVFLALAAAYFDYTIDDAYISLRYARNVAAGEGFVFDDVAPPVEGYTNFLWVLLEAAFFFLPSAGDVVIYAKLAGIAWGLGCVAAAFFLARRVFGAGAGVFAALFVAATGNFAFWAVAGLETTQYLCLILLALFFTLDAGRGAGPALLAGLAWCVAALARPEGFILGMAVLILGLFAAAGRRSRANFVVACLSLVIAYGIYFAWRWQYFGMALPNTFYARGGITPRSFIARVRGVLPFLAYAAPLAFLVVRFGRFRQDRSARFLTVAAAVSLALAFVAKREWMPGFRYELPFAAFLLVLAAGAFAAFIRRRSKAAAAISTALILIYLFIPGVFLFKETSYTARLSRAHVALAKWLARAAPPGSSLAAWDMGAVPYFSRLPVIYDINPEGLLSRETTRRGYNPDYFIRRRPTFFILYSSRADGVAAPPGNWAWRYYRSPGFRRAYEYLFTFSFREDYHLRVYVARGVALSPADLLEGATLARLSRGRG